ncbi:MAG: FG-GAP repeat protein, partial [Acidobacteria bacterium]|nr:FG-GAP repeat protein [Acidobacteriota bacterium]
MFKRLSTISRMFQRRSLLVTALAVYMVWLVCGLVGQPSASPRQTADKAKQGGANTPLSGEQAREYLEQTRDGQSLMAAMTPARFGLKWQKKAPVVDDAGAGSPLRIDPLLSQESVDLLYKSWEQTAILESSDGAADESFGQSVAISGNTAVVGSYTGKVKIFMRGDDGTWSQKGKMQGGGSFGQVVAVSGDTVLVGDYRAVHVYQWTNAEGWKDKTTFRVDVNGFGYSIAIDGDT